MGFWHRLATPTGFPEAELQSLPDIYPKLGLVIYLYHINRVLYSTLSYLNTHWGKQSIFDVNQWFEFSRHNKSFYRASTDINNGPKIEFCPSVW